MSNPDVSIIFVNYKTKDLTVNAIKSVQEKTEGISYEIFVVDNASNDGSIEAIEKEFPGINIIKNSVNAGFGAANNLAIKQAKGKYILCLNTDTLLINNAIKILFDFMEKDENKNVGVCGGILYDKDLQMNNSGGLLPGVRLLLLEFGFKYIFKSLYNKIHGNKCIPYIIEQIIGADIFFRKSVLDEVGMFDENFFMYMEETDLCKRIKDAGYKCKLVKDAKIIHLEGQSTKEVKNTTWFKTSQMYYFKKHYPYKVWLIKLIYIILYLINWLILGHKESKELLIFILKGCKE